MTAAPIGETPEATILVVDDKDDTRDAIIAYLEFEGFAVRRAENGEQALASIREQVPDMVLLDGMMPGMDGLDVLRTIRATPEHADLPVIMVTARGDTSDVARALKSGVSDYLIKPVQLELLVSRVRTALRLHKLEHSRINLKERLKRLNILTDLTLQILGVEGSEPVRRAAEEMRTLIGDLLNADPEDPTEEASAAAEPSGDVNTLPTSLPVPEPENAAPPADIPAAPAVASAPAPTPAPAAPASGDATSSPPNPAQVPSTVPVASNEPSKAE